MSYIIASPLGFGFLASSFFSVPRLASRQLPVKPPQYFWERATIQNPSDADKTSETDSDLNWLDDDVPAIQEDDPTIPPQNTPVAPKSRRFKKLAKFRQIVFKSFIPNSPSNKHATVVSAEYVSKQSVRSLGPSSPSRRATVFNSWKIKSKGSKTQVTKLVAVVRNRISSNSPPEKHPKTWAEYHELYANEQIDVLCPPLPPLEPAAEGQPATPFHARFYVPPRPANEPTRQLVVNRLGLFGDRHFDPSEEGAARAKARSELADRLEEIGEAPKSADMSWDASSAASVPSTDASQYGLDETRAMMQGVRSGQLPPETLEQHPVFRKIVKQCREMFGTAFSMLTIMDEDRQIFLAESGLGGMRDVSRDVTFCAHTILSGRKGFTILDTHKDWRFENGPLVQNYGSRFYAGVPLMAPNLDGSKDSDAASCPLGTLCVVDVKPRESFGVVDRKKLVYMAEYARREIEKWFMKKMEQKMAILEASHVAWAEQVKSDESSDENHAATSESEHHQVGGSTLVLPRKPARKRLSLGRFRDSASNISTPPTSPSSHGNLSLKSPGFLPGPTLFDDITAVVKPKMQKVFDLATQLVGDTLDLSLVYLIAARPPQSDSEETGRTMIISGYNIPLPVPVFDCDLHLRALRAPEGGLLYQNPSVTQLQEQSINPKIPGPEDDPASAAKEPYASAMLVAVGREFDDKPGGFVLGGFTGDAKRVFGAEDVAYMKQFAKELARYTIRLRI